MNLNPGGVIGGLAGAGVGIALIMNADGEGGRSRAMEEAKAFVNSLGLLCPNEPSLLWLDQLVEAFESSSPSGTDNQDRSLLFGSGCHCCCLDFLLFDFVSGDRIFCVDQSWNSIVFVCPEVVRSHPSCSCLMNTDPRNSSWLSFCSWDLLGYGS